MSANQIRLDELLARNVDVQWFEGVAIVQAVCRQLVAKGAANGEFPSAAEIGISTDGAVRILGTTKTKAVPAAAHLLAGLLSDDVPVRLRLAVSQATSEGSTIESLREFSEAIGYFERPDTPLIVGNLYDRAMLAAFRNQTDGPELQEFDTEEKREAAAKPSRDLKAILRRTAIAATVVIAIGAMSWLGLLAARSGRVSAAFNGVKSAFASAPEAGVTEPLEKPAAPAGRAPKGTTSTRSQRTQPSTASNSHGQSRELRKNSTGALDSTIPSLVRSLTSAMSPTPSLIASNTTEQVHTYVIVASTPDERASAPIYSKTDSEVTPPRQVYPALPAEPPATALKRDLTVVDLVIAPDGLVERVRLRTTPRDIHEFMLLSAAKAWRFKPALLDGRPVRFLHSVAITSFQ